MRQTHFIPMGGHMVSMPSRMVDGRRKSEWAQDTGRGALW
jgi:hypothetical protein